MKIEAMPIADSVLTVSSMEPKSGNMVCTEVVLQKTDNLNVYETIELSCGEEYTVTVSVKEGSIRIATIQF